MTTYTLTNAAGDVLFTRMTAIEAAHEVLTDDGARYELRKDGDAWQLFGSNRQGIMVELWDGPAPYGNLLRSNLVDESSAWHELAQRVIVAEWNDGLSAMSDDDYAAMIAELSAEG